MSTCHTSNDDAGRVRLAEWLRRNYRATKPDVGPGQTAGHECSISRVTLYVAMGCPRPHFGTEAESGKREAVWQAAAEHSGVETARTLLWKEDVSDGFTTLWELKRLDLSVEAYVLRPEYAPLFTEEDS